MLQRAMGLGAKAVRTVSTDSGVVCVVEYDNNRRGVVELTYDVWMYGGCVRGKDKESYYRVDASKIYVGLLHQVEKFFKGEAPACSFEDTLEVMAMIDAAQKSVDSGKKVAL
jgi:predicted dehydrogenase